MAKKQNAIIIYPGSNRDDDGKPLDLFSYIRNELDNRHIKCSMVQSKDAHNLAAVVEQRDAYGQALGKRTHALEVALSERDQLRAALETLYDWVEGNVAYGTPKKLARKVEAAIGEAKRAKGGPRVGIVSSSDVRKSGRLDAEFYLGKKRKGG